MLTVVKMTRWLCASSDERRTENINAILSYETARTKGEFDRRFGSCGYVPIRGTITVIIETEEKAKIR